MVYLFCHKYMPFSVDSEKQAADNKALYLLLTVAGRVLPLLSLLYFMNMYLMWSHVLSQYITYSADPV